MADIPREAAPFVPPDALPEQSPHSPAIAANMAYPYEPSEAVTAAREGLRTRTIRFMQEQMHGGQPDTGPPAPASHPANWNRPTPQLPLRALTPASDHSRYHVDLQQPPPYEDGHLTEEKVGHYVTNAVLRVLRHTDPATHAHFLGHLLPTSVERARLLYETRDSPTGDTDLLQRLLDGLRRL